MKKTLSLISQTADSICDGDLVEKLVRQRGNWSMLPMQVCSSQTCKQCASCCAFVLFVFFLVDGTIKLLVSVFIRSVGTAQFFSVFSALCKWYLILVFLFEMVFRTNILKRLGQRLRHYSSENHHCS